MKRKSNRSTKIPFSKRRTKQNGSLLLQLPSEILCHILSFLPLHQLFPLQSVSKSFVSLVSLTAGTIRPQKTPPDSTFFLEDDDFITSRPAYLFWIQNALSRLKNLREVELYSPTMNDCEQEDRSTIVSMLPPSVTSFASGWTSLG